MLAGLVARLVLRRVIHIVDVDEFVSCRTPQAFRLDVRWLRGVARLLGCMALVCAWPPIVLVARCFMAGPLIWSCCHAWVTV